MPHPEETFLETRRLLRIACSIFVRGDEPSVGEGWARKALAVLSPGDDFCSICRSYHGGDIQHACE